MKTGKKSWGQPLFRIDALTRGAKGAAIAIGVALMLAVAAVPAHANYSTGSVTINGLVSGWSGTTTPNVTVYGRATGTLEYVQVFSFQTSGTDSSTQPDAWSVWELYQATRTGNAVRSYLVSGNTRRVRVKIVCNSSGYVTADFNYDGTAPTTPGTPSGSVSGTPASTVTFSWSGASDSMSGLAGYYIQVGTSAGGNNVADGWIGNTTSYSFTGTKGTTYYARVRARDNVGNYGSYSANSAGVTVPSYTFTWSASNGSVTPASGSTYLSGEVISVQAIPSAGYTFTGWSGALSGTTNPQNLTMNGNKSVTASFADQTAPAAPSNLGGSPAPSAWSNSATVNVTWSAGTDSGSGVAGYSYVWDTSAATTPDTSVETTGLSYTSPSLSDGTSYYFHVRTVDNAGNASAAVHRGPFWIDRTAPNTYAVVINSGDAYAASTSVILTPNASDALSGVNQMQFSNDGSTWSTAETYSTSGKPWTLSSGDGVKTVYARYIDLAGNLSPNATDTITLDTTAPDAPGVPTSAANPTNTAITFTWTAASDGSGSGVASYDYQIATDAAFSNVVSSGSVPGLSSNPFTGTSGTAYFCRVRATDAMGMTGPYASMTSGVLYDADVPNTPAAPTGSASGLDVTFDWVNPGDIGGSGIDRYHVQIGTTPGGNNILDNANLAVLTYGFTGVDSTTYYARVRCRDAAGNWSAWSSNSGGVLVNLDNQAPTVQSITANRTYARTGDTIVFTITYTDNLALSTINRAIGANILVNAPGVTLGSVTAGNPNPALPAASATVQVSVPITGGNGDVSITVKAGSAVDQNSNSGPAADVTSSAVPVDNTAPTPTLSSSVPLGYTKISPIPVTLTFDEPVTGLAAPASFTATNCTVQNLTGSGSSYAFEIVPSQGAFDISVNAGGAKDTAQNNCAPSNILSWTYDTVAPVVTISEGPTPAAMNASGTVSFTVSFTEANSSSLLIALANGAGASAGYVTLQQTAGSVDLSNAQRAIGGTGLSRTIIISGITGNGKVRLSIDAGAATDGAGNSSVAAGPSAEFTVDNALPTATIGSPSVSLTRGGPVSYTVTYSDPSVEGVSSGIQESTIALASTDVSVSQNGSVSVGSIAISGSGSSRTITLSSITGSASEVSVSIPANTARDNAANAALGSSAAVAFAVDNTAPTFSSLTAAPAYAKQGATVTISFTASETLSADPTVTVNGNPATKSGASSGLNYVYTYVVSGSDSNGSASVNVSGTDVAGNSGSASTSFTVDKTAPTVSITSGPSPTLTGSGPIQYVLTFSGQSGDLVNLDVPTVNTYVSLNATGSATGALSVTSRSGNIDMSGTATCTIAITSVQGNGTLGISVNQGAASDAALNLSAAVGPSATCKVENNAPSVSISGPAPAGPVKAGIVDFTISYQGMASVVNDATLLSLVSVNATGTAAGTKNVLPGGAAPNALTGITTRTIRLTDIGGDGSLGISLASGSGADFWGVTAAAASSASSVTVDNTPPTISASAPTPSLIATGPATYTITYGGQSQITLASSDVTVVTDSGDAAAGTVTIGGSSGNTRSVTLDNCTGNGSLHIVIGEGTAVDLAGNLAPGIATTASVTVSTAQALTSVGAPSAGFVNDGSGVSFPVTFSNAASALADIGAYVQLNTTGTVPSSGPNAPTVTATGFTTAGGFVTVTNITGDGTLGITILAGAAKDVFDDNLPASSASPTVVVDNTAPTVTVSAASSARAGGSNPTTVLFTVTYADANLDSEGISLAASDVTLLPTGSVGGQVSVSGSGPSTRQIVISNIVGDGELGIAVASGTATDAAGNVAEAPDSPANVLVMSSVPGVTIAGPSLTPTQHGPVTYTVTYVGMKAVNLLTSDVAIATTGTATGTATVSGSGTSTRLITLTGISGDGTVSLSIPSGTGTDWYNDPAPAAASAPVTVDNTQPTVSVSAPSQPKARNGQTVSYTVTYAGADDIVLAATNVTLNKTGSANGTVSVTGSGITARTVTISNITGDGSLGISIDSGTASDLAGNLCASSASSATFEVDNTPPTLSVSGPNPAIANKDRTVTYTVNYSGADLVTLDLARITLLPTGTAAATVTVSGSGTLQRTVTLTNVTGDGTLALSVLPGSAEDSFGNQAAGAASPAVLRADNTAPVITRLGPSSLAQEWTLDYTDAGATASDNIDGDITLRIVTTNPVNVNVPGTYTVLYNVTDTAGNAAVPVTRTVSITQSPSNTAIVTIIGGWAYRDFIKVTVLPGRITSVSRLTITLDREPRFPLEGDAQILNGSCYRVKPETTFVNGSAIGPVQIWFKDENSDGYVDGTRVPVSSLRMGRVNGRTQQIEWMNASLQKAGETSLVANTDVWGIFFLAGVAETSSVPGGDSDGDGLLDSVEDVNGNGVWDHVDAAFPMRWPHEGNETDWQNWDTDGDGVSDGIEVALGTNPLDPDSPPRTGGQPGVPVATPVALLLLATGLGVTGARRMRRRRAAP